MKNKHETAPYKVIADTIGRRYRFFCGRSNMAICTTQHILADTPEEELRIAWETEGRTLFNRCTKCGEWVSDLMFNVDTSQCVICSPWEEYPNYCPACSAKVPKTYFWNEENYGFGIRAMNKVKVCLNCGEAAKASEQLCRECGAKLPEDTLFQVYKKQSRYCTPCDTIVPATVQYCQKCGTRLK